MRGGTFAGALVGVIALGENNLIAPTFRENLPRDTDAVLIDEDAQLERAGGVIYPPGRPRVMGGSSWAEAITAASHGTSGTLIGEANGQKALFAYAPVGGGTRYAVVFAWPWRTLTANIEQQGATLGGILVFGILVATIAGVLLSAYLTRPLQALADGAIRIARGEHLPGGVHAAPGRDRGDLDAARRVRADGGRRSRSAIRSCARRPACSSSACTTARRSWWRRRRRWSRPSASRRWARPRRRSRTS